VTDLPWTLHVFAAAGDLPVETAARHTLLLVIASVGVLLIAGWYFMWRGISRELRVARLQSDFVAAVSHEFRSPLTSLRQIAELLQGERFASEEQKRRSYDLLASEADRLGRLVEGLLDFARFEERGMEMRSSNVSLDELVAGVVIAFQNRSEVADRRLTFSPSKLGIEIKADRDALTRAIWNVVDNAVKYSPVGGTIRVCVDPGPKPGTACISVSDEGMGIPLEEQRTIFDRFVRGSEAKSRRIQGTGIGLALVRTIVRAHNGDIAVKSAPGAGSTFTLILPTLHADEIDDVRNSAVDFVDVAGSHQGTSR
jgi:signal transduction histidine kinase